MKTFEIKNIELKTLDVDEKARRVKVALNKTGVKDSDKDIIEATAFDKTIKERGPKGKDMIWHLTDHRPSLRDAVGKFKELFIENSYLVGVTDISETQWGNDVLEMYKSGIINQHSIGYATVKREVFNDDDWDKRYQVLKEVTLYEGSAVLWGANDQTPTLSVGKTLTKEERQSEFKKAMDDLSNLYKLFKTGHLSDSSFELIEIKMRQLTDRIEQLFVDATEADAKSLQPEENCVLNVLEAFNNNLKVANNGRKETSRAA